MNLAVFSTKSYDRGFLDRANEAYGHRITYFEARLNRETVALARGYPAVCVFVNDELDALVLKGLAEGGTRLIAMRCAGFNNVDLKSAAAEKIQVVRVPAYSPHAVAEHTLGLILTLNRKLHRAYNRVREGNFSLDGLLGFDLNGTTCGIVGTGNIGIVAARILKGFGCRLIAYDPFPNDACRRLKVEYLSLSELFRRSDIITLHCPLTPETKHLIDEEAVSQMKDGVMLINTSRGALVDTRYVIEALKSGKIGYLGLDVYEEESSLFFEDLSNRVIQDDVFSRLLTFPNVVITGHQGFFTDNALENISRTTLDNVHRIEAGKSCDNLVSLENLGS